MKVAFGKLRDDGEREDGGDENEETVRRQR